MKPISEINANVIPLSCHRVFSEAASHILTVVSIILLASCLESCGTHSISSRKPDILLLNATGTSPNDVQALERILTDSHLSYTTADSQQLNSLSEAQLRTYRLLIVP